MVALLTVDAKASAQWLAGLELSRKLNCLRALSLSPHCGTASFCVKFGPTRIDLRSIFYPSPHCFHA